MILHTATDRTQLDAYLAAIADRPLKPFRDDTQAKVFAVCAALIPAPTSDHTANTAAPAAPMSWPMLYARLFQIATGWLQWPPETAWNATPTEIAQAYEALVEKLKAIHGSGTDATDPTPKAPDPDAKFDREAFEELRASIGHF